VIGIPTTETQGATATIGRTTITTATMIEGATVETTVAGDHRIDTTMIVTVVMIVIEIEIATAGTAWIASNDFLLLIPTTTTTATIEIATIATTIATIEAACLLRRLVCP